MPLLCSPPLCRQAQGVHWCSATACTASHLSRPLTVPATPPLLHLLIAAKLECIPCLIDACLHAETAELIFCPYTYLLVSTLLLCHGPWPALPYPRCHMWVPVCINTR